MHAAVAVPSLAIGRNGWATQPHQTSGHLDTYCHLMSAMLDRAAERTDTILGRETAYGYDVGYGPNQYDPRTLVRGSFRA